MKAQLKGVIAVSYSLAQSVSQLVSQSLGCKLSFGGNFVDQVFCEMGDICMTIPNKMAAKALN